MKTIRLSLLSLGLLVSLALAVGAGGCGGGSNTTQVQDDQAGLTIFSIASMPFFSGFVNPMVLVQNNPGPPALKTQTSGTGGNFCPEFCYLKKGVLESVRQYETLDFAVCLEKKVNGSFGTFDFPSATAGGCDYFDVIFPNAVSGLPGTLRFRLCRNANHVTVHACEGGVLRQEMILDNDATAQSISGTLTSRAQNPGGCEDKSQTVLSANCDPDEFSNPNCQASLNQTVCGCYGEGTANYQVTGGDASPIVLASNFTAGGLGSATSGDFNDCSLGQGTAGSTFCSKSQSSGSFPAIPGAELPLSQIEGCEGQVGTAELCPDPGFDPNAYDPIYPTCPFEAASGSSCPFVFDQTGCCDLSGSTLETLGGAPIDPATASALFNDVSSQSCPAAADCSAFAFVDSWDCQPAGGESVATIDLRQSPADFAECTAILNGVNNFAEENNCSEQAADAEGQGIIAEINALPGCQSDNQCSGGQRCHIINDGGTPSDPTDDQGVCVTPPSDCDLGSPSCGAGETCAYDPEFNHAKCVPAFECPASTCASTQPCNTSTSACAFVSCNYLADDCAARLGAGFTCDPTMARCK